MLKWIKDCFAGFVAGMFFLVLIAGPIIGLSISRNAILGIVVGLILAFLCDVLIFGTLATIIYIADTNERILGELGVLNGHSAVIKKYNAVKKTDISKTADDKLVEDSNSNKQ